VGGPTLFLSPGAAIIPAWVSWVLMGAGPAGWELFLAGRDLPIAVFGTSMVELWRAAGNVTHIEVVAVDMPIGLSDNSSRRADVEARKLIGPRRSSVFPTPVRGALDGETYEEASALSRELTGKGLSKQTFALKPRILEIDAQPGVGGGRAGCAPGEVPRVTHRQAVG
jgi:hypothetical protein